MRKYAMLILAAVGCLAPAPCRAQLLAQTPRYELGQRVRRFELAWQTADAAARGLCVTPMEAAVSSFFRLQLAQAGRHLDEAYLTVLAGEPTAAHKWALSQRVDIEPLVVDTTDSRIRVRLEDFYDAKLPAPTAARIELQVTDLEQRVVTQVQMDLVAARDGYEWETGLRAEGDYRLVVTLHCEGQSFPIARRTFSRVERWTERIQSLKDRLPTIDGSASPTGMATAKQLVSLLESLRDGRVLETDYLANQVLQTCEGLCAADGRSEQYFSAQRHGDYLLTLSDGRQQLPVRVRVPERATEPLPVLVAYHGAGGSENMFFETYGAGRLVALGAERGWLVVAPRQGLLGLSMDCPKMLDILAGHFAIDRRRVFLVGHSLGAAQVVSQVSRHAAVISAAVALGGGRGVRDATPLKQVPWFVAAGERDFGRRGAQALVRSLEAAGARVRWLEVPRVEHLVIVQAALDDVFKFLDEVSQSPVMRPEPGT